MQKSSDASAPVTPIEKITAPLLRFLHIEAAGGGVLLVCTIIALILANSPWAGAFSNFWEIPLALSIGDLRLSHSLAHWVNDGLMTIFFFVVGLEIKRELTSGELKDKRAAMLPAMGALGGMIAPALFYLLAIHGKEGHAGWGIPMATDIAFVVGFLSLLGKRVPHGLKIFVLSLAIVDDLGAILVIAFAYSSHISITALSYGFLGLASTYLLNRLGARHLLVYILIGSAIWFAFLLSGIHPTISGVLLGLLTPSTPWASESVSPLERLERTLHPWVSFLIMPIFALANAGVPFALDALTSPVSLSVVLGLVVGKPIGIFLFSFIAVKLLGAQLPRGVSWRALLGAGILCGVGFTMSIFISGLALDSTHLAEGKVGTLIGSTISALAGIMVLFFALPKNASISVESRQ